jgi:RHS repeat-associated protein
MIMKRYRLFVAATLILWLAVSSAAQNQHPNQARGFNANGVYSAGDVDHVNLFNGNLTVTIPIGQPYPVNGRLSYSFTLVYNSNPWSPREVCPTTVDLSQQSSTFLSIQPRVVYNNDGQIIVSEQVNVGGINAYDPDAPRASSDQCWTIQDPNPATNAGLGWQLSFGKLYRPRDDVYDDRPDYTERSVWVYMSPDGSEHTFYRTLHEDDPAGSPNVWYTRDGSYLRLNMAPAANGYNADMTIEFPDGQKHYFQNLPVRNAVPEHQIRAISEEKLRAVEDQFGNNMQINYLDTDGDGLPDDKWVITDSVGRQHVVTFAKLVDGYQKVIQDISLESFGGTTPAHYGLTYEKTVDINRPVPHITPALIPESTDTLKAPLLTAVNLPNGSQYAMPVNPFDTADAAYDIPGAEASNPALLRRMVLPTGGQVEWKYEAEDQNADRQAGYGYRYGFGAAARHYLRSSVGVRRRIVTINKGAPTEKVYTWKYDPKVGDNYPSGCVQLYVSTTCSPAEFVSRVTTPEGDYTYNYFSIWPYPYGGQGVGLDTLKRAKSDMHAADYALPFTKDPRAQSDASLPPRSIANDAWNGYPLFLSQAVFDKGGALKRSVYVRYEQDVLSLNNGYGSTQDSNARLAATRTVYHDDGGVYAETQYLDFDGLGHYRQENILGNFGSGDRRLNIIWFNRSNGSYTVDSTTNQRTTGYTPVGESAPWLLETYDSKVSSDYTNYRSTTYYSFNNKGAVQAKRTLRNFETPSTAYVLTAKDVLVTYGYDAKGNMTSETFYGGDKKANLSTSGAFTATGAGEYSIAYSYQCSGARGAGTTSVASLSYYTSNPSLRLTDDTVDCSTGLPSSSRDPAGVQTTYQYDSVLRLTRLARQQGAIDKIKYFDVIGGSTSDSPQITVEHVAQDAGFTPLGDELYKYDQLGRLFEQDERMPGGAYRVKTMAYNGMGWKTTESEWNDNATTAGRQTKYDNFDPFGRPTKVTAPDGSVTQLAYNGVRLTYRTVKVGTTVNAGSTVTIGQADSTTVEVRDRQGRLWMVREQSGGGGANVYTTYAYNVNDQIVTATTPAQMPDGSQVTQTRTFTYDNLGNLRSENLPEVSGRVYDNYDTTGRVGTEYTGKSYLRYTYDFAGRLTLLEEQQSSGQYRPLKDNVYYSSNSSGYSLGKVQTARRYNWVINPYQAGGTTELGVVVREDYTYYGVDGRLDRATTRLNAETDITNHTIAPYAYTFDQTFTYDPRGNLLSQTYPQCANTTCAQTAGAARAWRANYAYQNNRLTSVGGGAGAGNADTAHYASTINYYINGTPKSVIHGNGARDQFDMDPNFMQRAAGITIKNGAGTQLWASGAYQYDGSGDITKIGSDWYAYDKVGRVVEGTSLDAGGKKRRYNYDAFGNVWSYQTYNNVTASGGSPVQVDNFTPNVQPGTNRVLLNYDGAGNAVGLLNQTPLYTYDALNMVKYAPGFTYLYAPDDERVWSLDSSALSAPDTTWVEDSLPAGAVPYPDTDGWNWTGSNPAPYAGSSAHQSRNLAGPHQHFFDGATATMKVGQGDALFAYVYIDPQAPPTEVMLQWDDGSGARAHRAFWGADQIAYGTPGTTSPDHDYRGALPPAGSWQRLEVPASAVGLENVTVKGMAFTLYGGKATWDHAGLRSNSVVETVTLRGLSNEVLREYQVRGGDAQGHWTWMKDDVYAGGRLLASETPQGVRHYHLDHLGTPKVITDASSNPLPGAPYTYFPFGEDTSFYPPADSHTSPADEKLRFAGQERNFDYSGLNLYYMHARYYFPNNAKFLSVDPGKDIDPADPQSWNLYTYARNNPVNMTDPDGRAIGDNFTPAPGYQTGFEEFLSEQDRMNACNAALKVAGANYSAVKRAMAAEGILKEAEANTGMSWKLIAAIGIRESGFLNRNEVASAKSSGGMGIYQIDSDSHKGPYWSHLAHDPESSTNYTAEQLAGFAKNWSSVMFVSDEVKLGATVRGHNTGDNPSHHAMTFRKMGGGIPTLDRGTGPYPVRPVSNYVSNVLNIMKYCFPQ